MHLSRTRARTRITVLASALTLLAAGITLTTAQVGSASPVDTSPDQATASLSTPPMGWNSWPGYGCGVTESVVKAAADAMASDGLAGAGYKYVNIDDCWQDTARDAQGKLQSNPTRFPSGIKALADYVHAKGLKLGIYEDAGTSTCGGYPGSLGHETTDAQTFADWGVDYLKYDNCNAGGTTARTRYTTMQSALRSTGRPIVFSLCNWGQESVWTWGSTVGNLWRTTADVRDSWTYMINNANQNMNYAAYAGPGLGWNDPDMLEIGGPVGSGTLDTGMTPAEWRTQFSLWAEMASPLMMGNRLTSTTPSSQLDVLGNTDVIAVDQDPLGHQGTVVSDSGGQVVMSKALQNGDRAVTLTNENDTTATISTTATAVGIAGSASYTLKDLWSGGTSTTPDSISASVPAHSTVMYRVTPASSTFEAEAAGNTLAGGAWIAACSSCSGGKSVHDIGDGATLTVNNVNVSSSGSHQLTITYLLSGSRSLYVSVNGLAGQRLDLTGTSWTTPATTSTSVSLNAGSNSIRFSNDTAYGPDLDMITVG